jgi:dihydrofolate synthase/folylpolyglutamate synthase
VFTSIGLEHTAILGNTVELIAAEKAGIIKKNVPILVGPNAPHDVIRDIAVKKGAEGFYLCPSVAKDCDDDGIIGFIDYDVENSMISKTAIEILQQKGSFEKIASKRQNMKPISLDIINEGISVRPTCRFELYEYQLPTDHGNNSVQVIFDVAHNPQAMKLLQAKLLNLFPTARTNSKNDSSSSSQHQKTYSYRFIVGFSSDKDLASCSQTLLSLVNNDPTKIHLVQASNPRAASLRDILASEPKLNQAYYNNNDVSINYQVQHALELITKNRNKKLSPNSEETEKDQNEEEIIVVCGSVFLMSEARESFGIDEPRDSKYIAQIVGSGYKSGQENFGNNALRNNK